MLEKFFHLFANTKNEFIKKFTSSLLDNFYYARLQKRSYSEKNGPNHILQGQTYDLKLAETLLKVELAANPKDRERGLMFRKSIGPKEGMLFVFKNGTKQRFWMKNTRIPLDIGYFSSNGSLSEIHKAKPYDLSGVPSRSRDIKFVLELNAGAYKKLGIRIGSRLDLKPSLKS